MTFKLALPKAFEEKLKFLVALGFGDKEAIQVKGDFIVPRDFLLAVTDRLPKPTVKADDHKDIVQYAKENEVDEIVVGVKRRSKVGKLVFGSNAQYVIIEAPCPVLTVK